MMKGYFFIIELGFGMNALMLIAIVAVVVIALFGEKKRDRRSMTRAAKKPSRVQGIAWGNQPESSEKVTYETWKNTDSEEVSESRQTKYRDKFRLMSKAEHTLYRRLVEAVPALIVFSQVSMSQVFHINGRTKEGYRQLGEVGRKSIDFLLCRPDDTSIILAIELNGPTHDTERQKASDDKKQSALEQAGIPLLILTPDKIPDVASLRKAIAPHIVERKRYEAERNERVQSTPHR